MLFWTRLLQHCLNCWAWFLSMTRVGPWHGKSCTGTGGDTTLRDSWTCCSRAGTQKPIPNTPKPAQEKSNKLKRASEEPLPVLGGFLQPLPGTSLLRTTLGITRGASAGALTFFLVPFLPRSLSHTIPAMHPSRRLLGTKSQLSLPQCFTHPMDCPGKGNGTHGACRNTGWSTGTMATARTCFMYSNSPSCWNDASRKIHREAQDYRNTNKSLDLNITHQDDFLT